jgi:glycosyltransferase involved in cell wall biosynthesis
VHVLVIQHTAAHGGSRQSLLATVRALVGNGERVSVACAEPPGLLAHDLAKAGAESVPSGPLPVFHFSRGSRWPAWTPRGAGGIVRAVRGRPLEETAAIRRLLDSVQPDILHLNSLVLAPVADVVQRLGAPYVWHVREPLSRGWLGVRAGWFRRLVRRAGSRMIYLSESDRSAVDGDGGLILENFVHLEEWSSPSRAQARAELGLAEQDFVVLYVGGPSRVKGPDVLIEALALARGRIPGLRLLAPGLRPGDAPGRMRALARAAVRGIRGGTYRDNLWRRLREIGLAETTVAPPASSDVRPFYAAADVVVFPSVVPHFARPAIEAMAAGRAFIGSRLAGVEQLVEEGKTGLLVNAGDAGALADAMSRVAADPASSARLGEQGRQEAERRFSAQRQVRKLLDHYTRVLDLPA